MNYTKGVFIEIHPSEVLKDELKARGITNEQFAKMLNVSVDYVNYILSEDCEYDTNLSKQIGYLLGISESFFEKLQIEYYNDLERNEYVLSMKWIFYKFQTKLSKSFKLLKSLKLSQLFSQSLQN
jgi:plasmid maintenance system antidote protein VapI